MDKLLELFKDAKTTEQQIAVVKGLGIFSVDDCRDGQIYIKTHKTVSKSNYMRLKKMNGGTYLKSIEFHAPLNEQNILILADISLKTQKLGQEALTTMKKQRLDNRYSRNKSPASRGYTRDGRTFASKEEWEDYQIDVVGYLP